MPVLERTLAEEQVARYDRDGCLVVPGVFAPDEIAEIRDTFMEQAKNGPVSGLSEIKRRQTGWAVLAFLLFATVLAWFAKKQVWAPVTPKRPKKG